MLSFCWLQRICAHSDLHRASLVYQLALHAGLMVIEEFLYKSD